MDLRSTPVLPDSGQLLAAAATLLVALASTSIGAALGARRPPVALVAGWGLACLWLVLGGTAGLPLTPLLIALAAPAALGLPRLRRLDWEPAWRVLVLGGPFLLVAASITPACFDEYSHWLPNLAFLAREDHFPSQAAPALLSIRPGYPHGLALVGLAVSRLAGALAETGGIVWNATMLLAMATLGAELLVRAGLRRGWVAAAVALLACGMASPAFVARLVLSNYGDAAVGMVAAVMVAGVLLDLCGPAPRWMDGLRLGLCGVALVSIRQDSVSIFALLWLGALGLAAWRRQGGPGPDWRAVAAMLPLPLLVALAWARYQAAEIPGGAADVLPVAAWRWHALPDILAGIGRTVLDKGGYFGLLALLAAVALWPRPVAAPRRAAALFGALLGGGKIALMVVVYLTVHMGGADERNAPEFWRFTIQVAPAVVMAALAVAPWHRLPWPGRAGRLAWQALPAVALLLPLIAMPTLRIDWPRPGRVDYPLLRAVAAELRAHVPQGARVALVDLDDDPQTLSRIFPIRYRLLAERPPEESALVSVVAGPERDVVTLAGALPALAPHDATLDAARRAALEVPFIWVADGGPAVSRLLQLDLPRGSSALLRRDGEDLTVLASWVRARP